eukprot:COSAG02_NODE_18771_length_920_cov_0.990256_1_plen_78_part_10
MQRQRDADENSIGHEISMNMTGYARVGSPDRRQLRSLSRASRTTIAMAPPPPISRAAVTGWTVHTGGPTSVSDEALGM